MGETPNGSTHLTAEMQREDTVQSTIVRRGMVRGEMSFPGVDVSSGFERY
jgi:hypothetical protein